MFDPSGFLETLSRISLQESGSVVGVSAVWFGSIALHD